MPNLQGNYSVDMLKKAAFVDELNNVLKSPRNEKTNETAVIINYLEKRIKQIDEKNK